MMETGLIFRTICLLFTLLSGRILADVSNTNAEYNDYSTNLLEVRLPMVKVGPVESFFGYSVAEHRVNFLGTKPQGATESVLLVGAPIYDGHEAVTVERPGQIFRCPYTTRYDDCESLDIDITENSPQENKTDQWLGVNVRSQGSAGHVVVCAHRYRIEQPPAKKRWGLGKCYLIKQNIYNLEFILHPMPPSVPFRKEFILCDNEGMDLDGYGYCQLGTGLGLSTFKFSGNRKNFMYMAIGAPGSSSFRGTTFVYDISDDGVADFFPRGNTVFDNLDRSGYSGFSVSVGTLNEASTKGDPNFVVSGAPRMEGSGVVNILKYDSEGVYMEHQTLYGINLTESFGYETVVIDINGDGLDDIVVGAPMHFDRKALIGGRIYIFLNNGSSETYFGRESKGMYNQYIDGPLDSMFGLSLANIGDINGDTAQELVVGAPYENNGEGAVYLFMGRKDGEIGNPIQKITPQTLNKDLKGAPLPNTTFGYSLSAGMDMDENGFPDLLVGAFESNSVVLLRTRPLVQPEYEIITNPVSLNAKTLECPIDGINKQCLTVKLNLKYFSPGFIEDVLNMDLLLEADVERVEGEKSPRVTFRKTVEDGQPPHIIKTTVSFPEQEDPIETDEYILVFEKQSEDIYLPIVVRATLSLPHVNATMPEPGEDVPSLITFPILDPHTVSTKLHLVNFTKRCDQDDGICITDLRVNASLPGLPLGSDGIPVFTHGIQSTINLKLNVDNLLEDAYTARVIIEASDVLMFDWDSSGICKIYLDNPSWVECELGNPFEEKDQKMTTIGFTKGAIKANQGFLEFNITATTTTNENNPLDNSIFLTASVRSETDLQLLKATDKSQYEVSGQIRGECAMENLNMIGSFVQHNWTVFNHGPAVVPEILVTIHFPFETLSGKWLLYLSEMPILIGGSSSYCVLPDNSVDVLNLTHPRGKDESGNVQTCFPKDKSRKRREVRPTPQAQSQKILLLECNSNNPTANCFKIKCYFTQVQNKEQTTVLINSRLWNSTFLEDYVDHDRLKIKINGKVEISNGSYVTEKKYDNNKYPLLMEVNRDFNIPIQAPKLKWWIILLAVIGGLILLILIILCLWKVGFFERHSSCPCGFFERKTMNYQYATVEQKSSGRKGKKEKTYMADDIHYTGGFD